MTAYLVDDQIFSFPGDVLYVINSVVNPKYILRPLDVEKLTYESGLITSGQAMFNQTNAVTHPIVFESSKDLCR